MTGYLIFVALLLLCGLQKSNTKVLYSMFFVITVFSSIRYGIGYDYYSYLKDCLPSSTHLPREIIPSLFEQWSRVTFPFLFFFLSSIFISVFYCLGIRNAGKDHFLEVLFYVCFPFFFFNQLGIIRQGMATAVIFLAICTDQRKILLRLLLVVIAFMCHESSIVALLIFFPWQKVGKSSLWILLLLSFFIGTLLIPLAETIISSGVLSESGSEKAMSYLGESNANEGTMMKYLILLICVLILSNYSRLVKTDAKNRYFIGLLVLGASLLSMFIFNSSLSKRLCVFFFTTSIILVPQYIKLVRLPKTTYVILCFILFFLNIYIGRNNYRDEDTNGSSVTYPYRTIFEINSI